MVLDPKITNAILTALRCVYAGNHFSTQLFNELPPHMTVGVLYPSHQSAQIVVEVEAASGHPAVQALVEFCQEQAELHRAVVDVEQPSYTRLCITPN